MDEIDRAQELNALHNDIALEEHRLGRPNRPSATHCEDCDGRIPEARRKASPGCTRCISCQEQAEILSHWRNA